MDNDPFNPLDILGEMVAAALSIEGVDTVRVGRTPNSFLMDPAFYITVSYGNFEKAITRRVSVGELESARYNISVEYKLMLERIMASALKPAKGENNELPGHGQNWS